MYFILYFYKEASGEHIMVSPLQSRQQHINALFLINDFTNETYCSSILDTASLHVSNKTITDL